MDAHDPITIDDVRAAARAIQGAVERTPTRHSETLSRIAGAGLHLKFENLQYTASFRSAARSTSCSRFPRRNASAASSRCRPATTPRASPITAEGSAFPSPS
ncbi:MAG: hypothetical protein WDM81_02875 [Rhizomicrobium sp.]